jgi:signal peptidase I
MTGQLRQRAIALGAQMPRRGVGLVLAFGLFAAWWVALAPSSLGGPVTYVVIRGDSMFPAMEGGDLVIVRSTAAYSVGDVVAYRVPAGELGEGRIVIHRIVGGESSGFVVQGDNNPAPDPWRPRLAETVGTVWFRVPAVGRILATLHQPAVAGSLAAAIVVAALVLRWLLPGHHREKGRLVRGSTALPSAVRRAPWDRRPRPPERA